MRNVWTRLRRTAVFVCAFVGLVFLLATFSPFVRWYGKKLAGSWTDPRGDILIVLGASSVEGFPGANTVLRCMYAVRAYQEGGFRKIVISGRLVGPHMRNLLIAEGVPPEVIVIEENSISTRENAVNVVRLLSGEAGSKVLMTSDYHMFRAARAFPQDGARCGAAAHTGRVETRGQLAEDLVGVRGRGGRERQNRVLRVARLDLV